MHMNRPAITMAFTLAAAGCGRSHPIEETGFEDSGPQDSGGGYHLGTVCMEETFHPTDSGFLVTDSWPLPTDTHTDFSGPTDTAATGLPEPYDTGATDTSLPADDTGPWSMPETGTDWVDTDCFAPGAPMVDSAETGSWLDQTCCDEWYWECQQMEDYLGIEHTGWNSCDWICNG